MEKEEEIVVDEQDERITELEKRLPLLWLVNEGDDEVSKLKNCITKLILRLQEKEYENKQREYFWKEKGREMEYKLEKLEIDYQKKSNYDKSLTIATNSLVEKLSQEVALMRLEHGSFNPLIPSTQNPEVVKFIRHLTKYTSGFDLEARTLIESIKATSNTDEMMSFMMDLYQSLEKHKHVLMTLRSLVDSHQEVYLSYLKKYGGHRLEISDLLLSENK